MTWQGWGMTQMGLWSGGSATHEENETDTSNGTWGWKVLRIWDTIGIILIQGGRGAGVSGSEEGCDVWS